MWGFFIIVIFVTIDTIMNRVTLEAVIEVVLIGLTLIIVPILNNINRPSLVVLSKKVESSLATNINITTTPTIEEGIQSSVLEAPVDALKPSTPTIAVSVALKAIIQRYIIQTFGLNARTALCIVQFEDSTYNPDSEHINLNGSIDRGIFQINSVHGYNASTLFNWKDNVNIAYKISSGGKNFNAWSTSPNCT